VRDVDAVFSGINHDLDVLRLSGCSTISPAVVISRTANAADNCQMLGDPCVDRRITCRHQQRKRWRMT
jgi:hypothetical protein